VRARLIRRCLCWSIVALRRQSREIARAADDARQCREREGASDRVVQGVWPPGRARPRRDGCFIRREHVCSGLARSVGVHTVRGSQYRHGGERDRAARPLAEAAPGCLRPRRRPSINWPGAVYAERGYSSPARLGSDESWPGPASGQTLDGSPPFCCTERPGPATSVVKKGSDRSAGRPAPL